MKELVFAGEGIVYGPGSIECVKNIKSSKVCITTGGSSMIKNGVIKKLEEYLKESNNEVLIHSGIKQNPDKEDVLKGLEKLNLFKPELIIAIGGGSTMDATKVMTIMYENQDIKIDDLKDIELPQKRNKTKLICIPSTAGTASEVTKSAVITFQEENIKIGLKSKAFIPDMAILDGNLTLSMPDHVVAESGIDAVTHAVECYINKGLDDFVEPIARESVRGLFENLPNSYNNKDIDSRQKVLNYQCMAGLSFVNIGLGMCHGISHAIGGMFHLGHGLINGIALPYVLKFNSRDNGVSGKLAVLGKDIGKKDFIKATIELNETLKLPKSFKEAGISEKDFYDNLEELVENSLKGSTKANVIMPTREEMKDLLIDIWHGNI